MKDLSGQVFNKLTAILPISKNKKRNWEWFCKCSYGREIIVAGAYLQNGHTKSCGCLKIEKAREGIGERSITHGECKGRKKTKLYSIWCAMHRRCNSISSNDFKWYGARGIKVCAKWDNYKYFMDWALSHGYVEGLTIDRIDSSSGYCPDNCQWLTNKENVSRARKEKIATGKDVTSQFKKKGVK